MFHFEYFPLPKQPQFSGDDKIKMTCTISTLYFYQANLNTILSYRGIHIFLQNFDLDGILVSIRACFPKLEVLRDPILAEHSLHEYTIATCTQFSPVDLYNMHVKIFGAY